ncbi:MAG: L-2-amino-thiazoline-4-carboxylic acid hydrolase [Anaerolineales bacterium]|nr:L-2-amino-thiazoline-4-carboxylic acid hydrolase [Anaerolineales bacterium]MDW8447475.1 L-2-amino-thiazoline-4-carboxylic acid hydrolase [Anaerolineales bacterium]
MSQLPPDTLNAIGVLKRREIEARLLKPVLEAFAQELGWERTVAILREVIMSIAREQGKELAEALGGCSLAHFAASLENWQKDDAMQIEILAQNEEEFSFNVLRCRYAEMYRTLGMEKLGNVLSCSRDRALIEGFNPEIELTRTQTIMDGAPFCDFRYRLTPRD